MALLIADRLKELSNTTGSGPFHLTGAVVGYKSMSSSMADGDQSYFGAFDGAGTWVVFAGTYHAAANTVSVDTVLSSSPGYAGFATAPTVWQDAPAALLSKLLTTTGTGILVAQTGPTIKAPLLIGNDFAWTGADSRSVVVNRSTSINAQTDVQAFADASQYTPTSDGVTYRSYGVSAQMLGTHSIGWNMSIDVDQTFGGSNNVSFYAGLHVQTTITGAGTVIQNKYGIRLREDAGSVGTIQNNYGIYIDLLNKGQGSNNYAIYSAGTTSSAHFGPIGIGRDQPRYMLDVQQSTNGAAGIVFTNLSNGAGAAAMMQVVNDLSHGGGFYLYSSGVGTPGALFGADTLMITASTANGISLVAQNDTAIRFGTGATTVERARINNLGLGVGGIPMSGSGWYTPLYVTANTHATAPSIIFQNQDPLGLIQHQISTDSGYGALAMYGSGATGLTAPYAAQRMMLQSWASNGLMLMTGGGLRPIIFAINEQEQMRLDSNGCLGVGTSAPNYAIDVLRNANAQARIQITNSNAGSGAQAAFVMQNSDGDYGQIAILNAAFGTAYPWISKSTYFSASGSGGINIVAYSNTGLVTISGQATASSRPSAVFGANGSMCCGNNLGGWYGSWPIAFQANSSIPGVSMYNTGGAQALDLRYDNSASAAVLQFRYGASFAAGNIAGSSSGIAFNNTSDLRLKKNIKPAADPGNILDAIEVVEFDWRHDDSHQRYGMIAQKLHEVFPDAVTPGMDDDDPVRHQPWSADHTKLIPLLVMEIQSLRRRVAQQETRH